jgi:hypothetical protein
MNATQFILKTLRQAHGAMRTAAHPPAQIAILRAMPDGEFVTYREIVDKVAIDRHQVAAMVHYMHKRRLIERQGAPGGYSYRINARGRAMAKGRV